MGARWFFEKTPVSPPSLPWGLGLVLTQTAHSGVSPWRSNSDVLHRRPVGARELSGQRTKDALAKKRAERVTLGQRTVLPEIVVERIVAAHSVGEGWSAIARALNADEVPTAQGGAKWHPSTVRAVALGHGRDAI